MKLELVNTDPRKPRIVLAVFPVIIGLDRDADVCLDDSSIGHYQCMIDNSDGTLMVWDLGTKLGTWINGIRVTNKAPLQSGDELTVGRSSFLVRSDDGQAKSSHQAKLPLSEDRPKHRPAKAPRREPALPTS